MRGKQHKSTALRELLARRLKAVREWKFKVATKAANAMGITKQTLHSYETGRNYPDELALVKFADATGCSLDFLFLGRITSGMPQALSDYLLTHHSDLVEEVWVPGRYVQPPPGPDQA